MSDPPKPEDLPTLAEGVTTAADAPTISADAPAFSETSVTFAEAMAVTAVGLPARIGRYRIVRLIGEGGMGAVYEAEQDQPRRTVALKVVKPGMDSRQVLARFNAERQALAIMDHPNIAKVFDAGTTDSGRPYFVMELVKGEPITDSCNRHCLSPRERLELFIQVWRSASKRIGLAWFWTGIRFLIFFWLRLLFVLGDECRRSRAGIGPGPERDDACRHEHCRRHRCRRQTHDPPSPSAPGNGNKFRG